MAAVIEVGDLHEHLGRVGNLQQSNGSGLHPGDDDEGLGRSYVCSMSSIIDLGCQDCGNCSDLARTVQCYLARIVEELHLISAWSSNVYHRQQQRTDNNRVSNDGGHRTDDSSFTAMARLAVVTDIELMRRDVAKTQHELFQRCTTQMAYVQNEANAAIDKQNTLVDELRQRMDESMHVWGQHAQSIQALEKTRAESDGQLRAMSTTLRQVQQQTAALPARIADLEKSLASVTTAQFAQEQEVQALQRRVESHETAHQLQLESTRRAAEDAITALRSAHSQLSSKMQVLRLEIQDSNDSSQKKMQQMLKAVSSVAASMSGKTMLGPGAAVPPRRPSIAAPRTPRSGGNTAQNQVSHSGGPGNNSDTLDDMLNRGGSTQTVMTTGADAMATSDCFIYAKAALPHRNSTADTSLLTKKSVASTGSSRGLVSSGGGSSNVTAAAVETKTQDFMANLLTVQQSVMSMPLGFEDDTRPATAIDTPKANTSAVDRRDPIIPTRRTVHRHSLPDVNSSVTPGAPSPHKFQASRLNAKQNHRKQSRKTRSMSTPDTISAAHHIATPEYSYELQSTELARTASTVRYSCGSSAIAWTSDDDSDNDSGHLHHQQPPTFETCSRAIVAAAERMTTLVHQPRSLAVAIAYDECLDIVTAAVNHMETIETRGVTRETVLDAYRAMHRIRTLLRPSPPVRRALQF